MELKENELRIGNLFDHMDDGILLIEEIKKDSDGFKGYYAVFRNGSIKCHVSYLQPIPLTEVFLLENGFKEKRYEYTIPISDCGLVTLTLIPHDEFPADCSVCVSQKDGHNEDEIENVFLSEIKYVHQLQNLFYALTNNELKLIK